MNLEKILNVVCETPAPFGAKGIPTLLWGPPGIGKTSRVNAYAQTKGWHVEVLLGSILDPTDISGLPVVDGGEVRFAPPEFIKRLADSDGAILFLDEINTSSPSVMAALLRLALERKAGNHDVGSHVRILAAANSPEQTPGGRWLHNSLANRFVHIKLEAQTNEVVEFMLNQIVKKDENYQELDEEQWQRELDRTRALVAAYLQTRPENLTEVPKRVEDQAWPSPRTWDYTSRLLATMRTMHMHPESREGEAIITGALGPSVGSDFIMYLDQAGKLPSVEAMLAGDKTWMDPSRADLIMLATLALADYAVEHEEVFPKVVAIFEETAEKCGKDMIVVAAKAISIKNKMLLLNPVAEPIIKLLHSALM